MMLQVQEVGIDLGHAAAPRAGTLGALFVVGSAILLVASEISAALGVLAWAVGGLLGMGMGAEMTVFAVLAAPALVWLVRFARQAWRNETALTDAED